VPSIAQLSQVLHISKLFDFTSMNGHVSPDYLLHFVDLPNRLQ
jgi:hypothetical protein